jgi:uncharacterized membrane protein YbhN (UPF0104 family)
VRVNEPGQLSPNLLRSDTPASGATLLLRSSASAMRWKIAGALVAIAATLTAIAASHGWSVGGLGHQFAAFSAGAIALACGAVTLQWLSQAGRLWVVASAVTHARWPGTLRAFAFGQVVNLYLPARMGDVVKAGMLGKAAGNAPGDLGRATGAVFIADKTLDFGTLAFILAACAARSPVRIASMPTLHARTLILVAVVVAMIGAGLYAWKPSWVAQLRSLAASVIQGAAALGSLRRLVIGLSMSVAAWSSEGLAFYVLAHAGGHALSFEQCLWVLALLNLGIAVPLSLANVGTFEASVMLATTSMGVPAMDALALATVHHAVQLLVTCALAFLLWIPARRTRRGLLSQSETSTTPVFATRVARAQG